MPDKGFVSRIDEELIQFNNKKTSKPIFKWAKDLTRHIPNKGIEMAN